MLFPLLPLPDLANCRTFGQQRYKLQNYLYRIFHPPLSVVIAFNAVLILYSQMVHSYLIYANSKEIRKLDENFFRFNRKANTSIIIDQLEYAIAVDFDYESNLIFWTDIGTESINCFPLNNTASFTVIYGHGITQPDGLACDWLTKKIYWVDSERDRIEVVNYDGTYRTVIFWKDLDEPRAIALVPSEGLMFWSDWGPKSPKIERASMDGDPSSRTVIIDKDIIWPNELTVDYEHRRLYWNDAKLDYFSVADFDGQNRQKIVCADVSHPFGLDILGDMLYWSDWDSRDIHACNINTLKSYKALLNSKSTYQDTRRSKEFKMQLGSNYPQRLSIFDASRQPKWTTQCQDNNGGCSHLCLLASSHSDSQRGNYSCACPTGIHLLSDGKTCLSQPEKFLLLVRRFDIRRISLDTQDYTPVTLPIKGIKHANVLDYDPIEGKVYWGDDDLHVIKRAFLNGSQQETIVSMEVAHPDGIAIDWMARNIYWTDGGTNRIEVARLDGTSRKLLIDTQIDEPRAIVIHPEEGIFFWSDWGNNAKIERASLDGSDRIVIVKDRIVWPNGLAIDYDLSHIYWCDARLDTIEMSLFDGSQRTQKWKGENTHFFSLTLFGEWIYWTDWQRRTVERLHKLTGKGHETIVDHVSDLMTVKSVWRNHPPQRISKGTNECAQNNGNCSHLCFNLPHNGYVCSCPTRFELLTDKKTCAPPKVSFLLLRSKNLSRMSVKSPSFVESLHIPGLQAAIAFDMDMAHNTIFWIDAQQKEIKRASLNGSIPEVVIHLGLESPEDLAIDWIAKNIYWTDSELRRIEVSRLDGSFRRILITDAKKSPHSIQVDPNAGWLFWSDWSGNGKLERSFLDGERIETIVDNARQVTSLVTDSVNRRLYWIDLSNFDVLTVPYEGGSRTILMKERQPSSLTLYGELLYFVDKSRHTIKWLNTTVTHSQSPQLFTQNDLFADTNDFLVSNALSQKGWNLCAVNNGDCPHLCFARPSTTRGNKNKDHDSHHCSCSTHYKLEEKINETTQKSYTQCIPPDSFLLFSQRNATTRFMFDGEQSKNDFQDVIFSINQMKNIKSLAYDPYEQYIYWIDKNPGLKRIYLNGSGFENIAIGEPIILEDLVIDPYARVLFWTCSQCHIINATRLIGQPTHIGAIYNGAYDSPRLLAYHFQESLLFWTNELQSPQIEQIAMFTGKKITVVDHLNKILAIAVDQELNYLIWADSDHDKIEYSTLQGLFREKLYADSNLNPIAMTSYSKYIFWVEKDKKSIEKVALDPNKGRNKQTIFLKTSPITDIISVLPMKLNSSYLYCTFENGGCSHLCFLQHKENIVRCACPQGLVLSKPNEKTCIEPIKCDSTQFSCSGVGCIDSIFRCNGLVDCADGSDELNCPKCKVEQFSCLKNVFTQEFICLDKEKICDGVKDCFDGHDERCCSEMFLCHSRHCLTSNQVCDHKPDCRDGEDEDENFCRMRLTESSIVFIHPAQLAVVLLCFLVLVSVCLIFCRCNCLLSLDKEVRNEEILMREHGLSTTFSHGLRNNRSPHRSKFSSKKSHLLFGKLENCNTLTSTTTISALDSIPNELQLDMNGGMGHSTVNDHPAPTQSLIEASLAGSSNSSGPVAYPCMTKNPPPSPATERSQSAYSTHSSSFFVPRTRNRNMNTAAVFGNSKSSSNSRRHKKSKWRKQIRGPPPTPCGTDVYDEVDPTSVKYGVFYDNTHAEQDELDYQPPPPTPRNYFSDPSCPPSPGTERSFCNPFPPPPSPVQVSD